MSIKPPDTIILLYPSAIPTKELQCFLKEFCESRNINIIEVISLSDEYDYFSMRRLLGIIKYHREPISLVTNQNMLTLVFPLTFWTMLEAISSDKFVDTTLDLFYALKKENADKIDNQATDDFCIIGNKEVGRISDWMNNMQFASMC